MFEQFKTQQSQHGNCLSSPRDLLPMQHPCGQQRGINWLWSSHRQLGIPSIVHVDPYQIYQWIGMDW